MAEIDLRVGGMTCASCAARVEEKLNRPDGVVASVNFATETARVEFGEPVSVDDLVRTGDGVLQRVRGQQQPAPVRLPPPGPDARSWARAGIPAPGGQT
ncbi:MAG: heavy-metal-associated domain-containing protein [Micromonosporaceae bacterium]